MTGRDDKMPPVLVLEFRGRPSLGRTTSSHNLRHIPVGDGRGRPGTVGDGPSLGCVGQVPEKTGRDDRMPSVLVIDSYLSGNFRKWLDGTTNCRPSLSWLRTDCPVANTGQDFFPSYLVQILLVFTRSYLHSFILSPWSIKFLSFPYSKSRAGIRKRVKAVKTIGGDLWEY